MNTLVQKNRNSYDSLDLRIGSKGAKKNLLIIKSYSL